MTTPSNLVMTFNKYILTSAPQIMMHNEVEGVDWILHKIFGKLIFHFGVGQELCYSQLWM